MKVTQAGKKECEEIKIMWVLDYLYLYYYLYFIIKHKHSEDQGHMDISSIL